MSITWLADIISSSITLDPALGSATSTTRTFETLRLSALSVNCQLKPEKWIREFSKATKSREFAKYDQLIGATSLSVLARSISNTIYLSTPLSRPLLGSNLLCCVSVA